MQVSPEPRLQIAVLNGMATATCLRPSCSYQWLLRIPNPKQCPKCGRRLHPPVKPIAAPKSEKERELQKSRQRERKQQKKAANPEIKRQRNREWIAANLERRREIARKSNRNRRARKLNAICQHGPGCFDIAARGMPQRCAIPGCRNKDIHADHIIPLALGGKDCKENLQPLCGRHNSSKHATDPIDFARQHGMLF